MERVPDKVVQKKVDENLMRNGANKIKAAVCLNLFTPLIGFLLAPLTWPAFLLLRGPRSKQNLA